jgi:uncharacterized protein YkwD
VTEPRTTLSIDGADPVPTRRTGAHAHRTSWRRPGPLGLAAIAAGALCAMGLVFALLPLLRADPRADALPVTAAASGGSAPAGAITSASPTPSLLRSLPPVTGGKPTSRPADLEDQLVSLTNQARSQAGCHPVKNDSHLHSAARTHSNDMAKKGFLSQTGSDGSSFADRIRKAGYHQPLSENVGQGYQTAQQAIAAWQANARDRANLLNCAATAVGVGVTVAKSGVAYWTEDFGN